MPADRSKLERHLQGASVCVCVGAGGVGKTTVSAALALGLAARGAKTVVVSIDPAKRLATALGMDELPGRPHRVQPDELAEHGVELKGELWAMVLDSSETFHGLVDDLAPDEKTREGVLTNRVYREISSAVAGSQEFAAVAKLYELHREGGWDAIVLDTPPSRNALDFLDAPDRLTRFFDGRALKLLRAPGSAARGLMGRGAGIAFGLFSRLTGVDVLAELSGFFGSLSEIADGFRERARGVQALLRDPGTRFLVVTSPEREPAREAVFMGERLAREGMAVAAVIANLVHDEGLEGREPAGVAALLAPDLGEGLAGRVARNLADFDVLASRDRDNIAAVAEALGEPEPVLVGQLDGDPQDLGGLAVVASLLFE